jgi:hypothetical protein
VTAFPGTGRLERWTARAAVALVAPLAAAAGLAVAGVVAWADLAEARSVLLFAALAGLAAAAAGGLASALGRGRRAWAWLAVAVALGACGLSAARRVEGTLDLGQGEEGARWSVAGAGLRAPPAVKALVLPAGRAGNARARLLVDGREVSAPIGEPVPVGAGLRLVVKHVVKAPALAVRRTGGAEEGAALVKLVPGKREWFEVSVLPHRFYVTLAEDSAAEGTPLDLRVQRGKLRVHEGVIAPGRDAGFEGIVVSVEGAAPWARMELRWSPGAWEPAAAAIVALLVFALARRAGRARA